MTIELVITIAGFALTVIGIAIKYGADKQALLSKNELQDTKIEAIKERQDEDRIKNAEQHKDFYENKNVVIELKNDIGHIMDSLGDIKVLLGDRRGRE